MEPSNIENNFDELDEEKNPRFPKVQRERPETGFMIDDRNCAVTPNGSFWDEDGRYFNRNGFDYHGGHYDEFGTYQPGEKWNNEKLCYDDEVNTLNKKQSNLGPCNFTEEDKVIIENMPNVGEGGDNDEVVDDNMESKKEPTDAISKQNNIEETLQQTELDELTNLYNDRIRQDNEEEQQRSKRLSLQQQGKFESKVQRITISPNKSAKAIPFDPNPNNIHVI